MAEPRPTDTDALLINLALCLTMWPIPSADMLAGWRSVARTVLPLASSDDPLMADLAREIDILTAPSGYRTSAADDLRQFATRSKLGLSLAVEAVVARRTAMLWERWQAARPQGGRAAA